MSQVQHYDRKKDEENVNYLIERLLKECRTKSNSYIGVEYDNLNIEGDDPNYTLTRNLFDKILMEMNTMCFNSHEYIKNEFDEDLPFRTERNVMQYLSRLGKFVEKYAPKFLDKEDAEELIKEAREYANF